MDEKIKLDGFDATSSFTDIVEVNYITPENSIFSMSENGFLSLVSSLDIQPEKLFEDAESEKKKEEHSARAHLGHGRKAPPEIKYTNDGKRDYGRVILHRSFPFDAPDIMISVQQEDGFEIGIIKDIGDFDKATADILNQSLDTKYFVPTISKILSAKDNFGFVYFKAQTDCGDCEFVVRDPFRSIIHSGKNSILIIDIDANRYRIEDTSALDHKSYKKIELYI